MDEPEYLRRLGFEHELIGRRIGWLLASQTILLTAYGLTLDKGKDGPATETYRFWIPRIGLLVALVVLFGVVAAALAKYQTWRDFREENSCAEWGVRTYITLIGLVPDFGLPITFAFAWLVLACRCGP